MLNLLIRLAVLPVHLFAFLVRLVTAPLRLVSALKNPRRYVLKRAWRRLARG